MLERLYAEIRQQVVTDYWLRTVPVEMRRMSVHADLGAKFLHHHRGREWQTQWPWWRE